MKKDLIFAPILLVIGALLFLYDFIGAPAHIALAMAGVKLDIDGFGRYKLLFVPHAEEMEGELLRFFNDVMNKT